MIEIHCLVGRGESYAYGHDGEPETYYTAHASASGSFSASVPGCHRIVSLGLGVFVGTSVIVTHGIMWTSKGLESFRGASSVICRLTHG